MPGTSLRNAALSIASVQTRHTWKAMTDDEFLQAFATATLANPFGTGAGIG